MLALKSLLSSYPLRRMSYLDTENVQILTRMDEAFLRKWRRIPSTAAIHESMHPGLDLN